MTEGMQHIRIMEGMSRSLPSSPLLTHQTISMRLQPVKKLTGKDGAWPCDSERFKLVEYHISHKPSERKPAEIVGWTCLDLFCANFRCLSPSSPKHSLYQHLLKLFTVLLWAEKSEHKVNFLAQSVGEWISEAFCGAGWALSRFLFVSHS